MSSAATQTLDTVQSLTQSGYKWGWETDIEMDLAPKGLNEDIIRLISARKEEPDWLLEWRLKAYAAWQQMTSRTGRASSMRRSTTRTCTTTRRRRRSRGRRASTRSIRSC